MESYHVVIRRSGSRWRWLLMELDILVRQGFGGTWAEAQRRGEAARKEYVRNLRARRKIKISEI